MSTNFTYCQQFSRYRAKALKIVVFYVKSFFYVITFDLVKTRQLFCQHRVFLVNTRRMTYKLTLKSHVESLTSGQGHDLTRKGHVAYQSIRIVNQNTAMVFSSL